MGEKIKGVKNWFKKSKYSPIHALENEEKRTIYEASTGRIKVRLTKRQALGITALAIISAFISAYTKVIMIFRYSRFEGNYIMWSWHPYVAPLMIFSISAYIFCCLRKGVDYWLVYLGAFMGLSYFIIEGLLIHDIVDIEVLAGFFNALGFGNLPEWIVGPGV